MDAAIEMASEIAEKSPVAVQGTKVNLNYARDHSVQDALEFVVSSVKNKSCSTFFKFSHIFPLRPCGTVSQCRVETW